MDQPTIETERLTLRPFAPEDEADVVRLVGDRAIADTTLNIPHPYAPEDFRTWQENHESKFEAGEQATFAMESREDGRLVGAVGMGISKQHANGELGYWVAKDDWNRGYATEAARAVVRYAFDGLGLRRVHARHLTRNPASGRVMEKIGMRREGVLRRHILKWDVPEDVAWWGILAEEF